MCIGSPAECNYTKCNINDTHVASIGNNGVLLQGAHRITVNNVRLNYSNTSSNVNNQKGEAIQAFRFNVQSELLHLAEA